jgi:hypothetical protein
MQVMRLILSGQVDPKTAGLLLYALQTASSNLSRINFEPAVKTRVVIDPRTVDQTPLGEDPWCPEDFEVEDDQNEVSQAEAIGSEDQDKEAITEEAIPQIQAAAAPVTPRRRRSAVASPAHGIVLAVPHPLRNRPRVDRRPAARARTLAPPLTYRGVGDLEANGIAAECPTTLVSVEKRAPGTHWLQRS